MTSFKVYLFLFQLWILRTKANLDTRINTMISMECLVRVFECSFLYCFKAWILTISPILGYSVLPSPLQCYIGSLLTYLGAVAASTFSLLTNFLR